MTLNISNLKPAIGSIKKRKRVGRGNSSGHGTYSTRGLKGQKSRSGVSGLKRLGMRQVLLRTPKLKGFTSLQPKDQVVNLSLLNRYYKDGEVVSPQTLLARKLIKSSKQGVKILGDGELKLKNLQLVGLKISKSAWEKIKNNKIIIK
ncbi:MAG: 50S ribosomal protein L15 [Candidatus Falkowbacteria bacterium]|nr:50S ribosomal protein L15 [Candidatus Falkowbacteria bacterium]